ncbi:hypothetical protein IW15_21485 [Chryseobacterium soli]|uniref:Uncharacterized protein n=1 Tax=Chryseobacterium soli TaxID=445961 RepID=A0A086A099_9FLAO|nr:hypothetical protein [Chryseobacterium soli]KFF10113.1 hypothetical protein IW15_21485 [Chryseobacterium soli]
MKLLNRKFFELFFSFIIILFLYNSCKSAASEFYYNDRVEKTEYEKMAEESYFTNIPKEQQKTDKDVLVIFSGSAFKGKTVIINKKDSLSFNLPPDPTGCYGILFKKIPKSTKKIRVSVEGKKDIFIPIIDKSDYIDIGDAKQNKWGVGYSKNFPSYFCM